MKLFVFDYKCESYNSQREHSVDDAKQKFHHETLKILLTG